MDWVKFIRKTYSDGGTIDRWSGDCIDNPNNPTKHQMQLNTIVSYYRYNEGEWISNRDLFQMAQHWQLTDLPASMIWENCYDEYQKILKDQLNSTRSKG